MQNMLALVLTQLTLRTSQYESAYSNFVFRERQVPLEENKGRT